MKKVKIYKAENEPVLGYKKGSEERKNVERTYNEMFNSKIDVPLYIGKDEIFTVEKGLRVAQMVICPVIQASLQEVDELSETTRGEGGFGSTNQ